MIKIRMIICWFIVTMISSALFSWSSHGVFTFLTVTSIANFDYQKLVKITDYSYVENRKYKEGKYILHDVIEAGKFKIDAEDDVLNDTGIDVINSFVLPTQSREIPVWAIFLVYSSFPDNGMDYVEESFFINALIGSTQANRHGYLKVSFFEYMEGDKSFLHFVRMSREAFKKGDEYWGYRFLAYALHYLEDLMQPYHVRPGTVPELIQFIFDQRIRVMLRNAHSAYDDYMTFLLYKSKNRYQFTQLINNTQPLVLPVPDEQLIYEAIVYSYSMFFDIHEEVKKAFGKILYERRIKMEDFEQAEREGKLERLYELTKKLASTLASLVKGIVLSNVPM
ncbi:hypothetical protein [Fervidobacterium sp.]